MIALNGKHIDLKGKSAIALEIQKDFKQLKKEYGFPIRFKFPEEMVKPNPENHNRPFTPNSVNLQMTATCKTDEGSEVWTYYSNTRFDKKSQTTDFIPRKKVFDGNLIVNEQDIELAWFLIRKHPHCKNGDNTGASPRSYFMVENKVKEADDFVKNESYKAKAVYFILTALDKDKILELAKSYYLPKLEDLNDSEVRKALLLHVEIQEAAKKGGYREFVSRVEDEKTVEINNIINEAVNRNVIMEVTKGNGRIWHYAMKDKDEFVPGDKIIGGPKSNDGLEILHTFLSKNKHVLEDIKKKLK